MISRRTLLSAIGAGTLSTTTFAQAFPNRPVRLIVPFGPGTTADLVARIFAEGLTGPLGQSVFVENKSGAGGNIGVESVARGAVDGHTIILGTVGTHAINPGLYRKMNFDVLKDFAPIGFAGATPTLLVVAANSPYKSLKDLQAAAVKAPGLSFASAGNGTSGHLAGELLKARLGGEMVHVPYKEGALALNDVMAGQVQFMFYHPVAVLSHIKAGKLRALGVSSAKRTSVAPDVPAIAEQGFGDFDLMAWMMLYAPATVPDPVLAKLRNATAQAAGSADVRAKLAAQGLDAPLMSDQQMAQFGRIELAKWSEIIKRSGAQVD